MSVCVKKVYDQPEAIAEVESLRRSAPEYGWRYHVCSPCRGFHLIRVKRKGYVSSEKQKAIALWLAAKHD